MARKDRLGNFIDNMGSLDDDSNKLATYRLEHERKLKEKYDKKYRDDKQTAELKYAKALGAFRQKQEKESHEESMKRLKEQYTYAQGFTEKLKLSTEGMKQSLSSALGKAAGSAIRGIGKGIDDYMGSFSKYMSDIETRLQGSNKTYTSSLDTITKAIGSSPYVSQPQVLENLSKLVESGITYNVEQRAFLATVSDRIITTFDAFDSSLLQIIKIQQTDSTIARMGMESQLNKFLNANFGDTSYLNNNFNSVASSLLAASSTLSTAQSVEFEYIVQKWLGSMGSVGVTDSTLSTIAQGLGHLGSGNLSALSSNQGLQNLLVMASNRAGLDYGSLLTGGVSSKNANALLKSIVEISQSIASSDNRLVLSQYAEIFGMNITDIMAIGNITSENLLDISKNMLTYESMRQETESQLSTIGSRMSLQNQIDTLFSNVMSTIGEGIAGNAASYATWVVANMVEKATGGINIPFVSVLGSGVDLNATVTGLIKTGLVGYGALSNIGTLISGLSGKNNLSLDNWGATDTRVSGQGFTGIKTTGISTTSSNTTFVGSTSESDIYDGSVGAAKEAEKIEGDKSDELLTIIKENIAADVRRIYDLLYDGIEVKISSFGYNVPVSDY